MRFFIWDMVFIYDDVDAMYSEFLFTTSYIVFFNYRIVSHIVYLLQDIWKGVNKLSKLFWIYHEKNSTNLKHRISIK